MSWRRKTQSPAENYGQRLTSCYRMGDHVDGLKFAGGASDELLITALKAQG